ncbi:MAG: O-antigen ligase family protein [Planctomycetes bacterium]|nr:O-antigen ligase family protein [Planctomycetota bacterium]
MSHTPVEQGTALLWPRLRTAAVAFFSPEAVGRLLRRAVVVLGAAGLLVLPQFVTSASFDGVQGIPGPVTVLVLGLGFWLMPVLLVVSWVAEGRVRLAHPWLLLPVGLFVAGAAVSTALAADKSSALVRAAELTGLWVGAWALAESLRSGGERRFLLAVLVAAAAGAAAVGIYQAAYGLPQAWQYFQGHREEVLAQHGIMPGSYAEEAFIGRFTGGAQAGLGHPNVLAALLVLGLLVAAGLAREKWSEVGSRGARGLAVFPILAAVACAAGLVLTQSRGGEAAAVLGLWWLVVAWRVRRRWLRVALYLAPLVAGGAALALAAGLGGPGVAEALKSLRYRLDYWQATAEVLRRYGLAGVGFENFGLYYTEFKLPTAVEEIRDPHNLVLSIWSSLGLAGLAALAGLVVVAVRAWLRKPQVEIEPAAGAAGYPPPEAAGHSAPGESLLALLVPVVLVAGPVVIYFMMALVWWPLAVGVVGGMMVLMGLAVAEEPSGLAASGRPLRSLVAACIAALAALALMEQIGTAILEPPAAWAALVVLGVSLGAGRAVRAADVGRARCGSGGVYPSADPMCPGLRLGSWAKFGLMLLAMAAGFAYARFLLVPVAREDALFGEARAAATAYDRDTALQAAARANPLAWEPALARGRTWQAAAAAARGPQRTMDLERATQAYREALARQPRLRHAYLALAACRLSVPSALENDPATLQEALDYTRAAARLYPTDIPTQAQAAALADALGDGARALAEYRRLLDLDGLMPDEDRRLAPDMRRDVEKRVKQLEEPQANP